MLAGRASFVCCSSRSAQSFSASAACMCRQSSEALVATIRAQGGERGSHHEGSAPAREPPPWRLPGPASAAGAQQVLVLATAAGWAAARAVLEAPAPAPGTARQPAGMAPAAAPVAGTARRGPSAAPAHRAPHRPTSCAVRQPWRPPALPSAASELARWRLALQ